MNLRQEYLKTISVLRLREIGRACGVKAPTSLNKNQLIQAIIDIEDGVSKPYFNTTNRGRPALSSKNYANSPNDLQTKKIDKIQKLIDKFEKDILKVILE